jgi:hypothetical protein
MLVNSSDLLQIQDHKPSPTRDEDWHVWPVTIPRQSITGRLVWGTVLRRQRGADGYARSMLKLTNPC